MWEVRQSAERVAEATLGGLVPREVLVDVDGPRIFTTADARGDKLLAYQCGEDAEVSRLLLVPTNDHLIERLRTGLLSLRGALLSPPWLWLADMHHAGGVRTAWRITATDVPDGLLPARWIGLLPEHEPWLALRLVGAELEEGSTPASVVKRAVDAATKAMKSLTEHVLDIEAGMGRPNERLRRLYDLPITSFAFSSFEVVFGSPSEPRQAAIVPVDDPAFRRVRDILSAGLDWASNPAEELEMGAEAQAMLEALSRLAPPLQGIIESVEVGGRLAGTGVRTLSRDSSRRVRQKLEEIRHGEEAQTYRGLVREFDKDRLTFIVRDRNAVEIARCSFEAELYDDAMAAFESESESEILAVTSPGRPLARVVGILPKE